MTDENAVGENAVAPAEVPGDGQHLDVAGQRGAGGLGEIHYF